VERRLSHILVQHRIILSVLSLLLTLLLAVGAKNLYVNNNYNIFFDLDDPQVVDHELHQSIYTKTDNIAFLVHSVKGDIFTASNLALVKNITEQAWQTPFSIRVDSLTNFQNSWAEGDELVVEDLVDDTSVLDENALSKIKQTALTEKQLLNRVISHDGATTLINVSLEIPEYPDEAMPHQQRVEALQQREEAVAEIVSYGRQLRNNINSSSTEVIVHMLGEAIINHNLTESSDRDAKTLIPLMFLVIILTLAILLRSIGGIVGAVTVIFLSVVAAVGGLGWFGYSLNMVNSVAPIIILTIAVCDSVHLLSVYLYNLSLGQSVADSMRNSLEVNLHPIFITSLTTAVGFLTLNFSESPPFRELGNISALGVMFAMLLTLLLLPTISMLLIRKRTQRSEKSKLAGKLAEFIIRHRKPSFIITLLVSISIISFIPFNKINDDPALYFKQGNSYRDAIDFSQKTLPGAFDINFSLSCGSDGCIHDPLFLAKAEEFEKWLLVQPNVESVASYVDVIKRINRNLHGDEPSHYVLPSDMQSSAQYNLLYELSLPYGLDLNNLINFEKSSLRVSAFTRQVTTGEFVAFEAAARQWLDEYDPELGSRGSSIRIMFASLGEKNIYGMMWGALLALVGVTLTILLSLRSLKYAAISFIPNSLPAAIALGMWGASVAEVNMGVAAVFSITLGIIIDDSVHFISKYRRAREIDGKSAEESIHYAFETVGPALATTTVVLAIGFSMLILSDFNLNVYLGALTAMTVAIALIFDFFILPPLLLFFDRADDG
jgi:predicted RND superfamily exporter protein